MRADTDSVGVGWQLEGSRIRDYLTLTKPDVTALVVGSALAAFYLGSQGPLDWVLLFHTLAGTALVSGGTAAFNHFLEREADGCMRRTARRPLPAGRLEPRAALLFAAGLTVSGVLYLALRVNLLASFLAFLTWGTYLFLYTPLKKKTVLCTAVGAFPGAAPALIGWAAARNSLGTEAWVLYAILFLWQFPHFLSIAWMYREDYARGGIRMLPVVDPSGRSTGRQMVFFAAALLPVAALPTLLGMAGTLYLGGALGLSAGFLYFSLRVARIPTNLRAKHLLQTSVLYLPLLFALLTLDKQ
ncbi:MAG: heme o synthase [Terriglobia bacterium]